jgi:hypothetical protein
MKGVPLMNPVETPKELMPRKTPTPPAICPVLMRLAAMDEMEALADEI